MAKCKHLSISEEAYRDGEPAGVFLCTWPVSRMSGAPEWMRKMVGGGQMVQPGRDCADCPAFERCPPA